MFKIKRFRKIVMKYTLTFLNKPEIIKQNVDYYILDLQNLIKDVNLQLEKVYYIFEKICILEEKLSAKSNTNIFWKYIQKITDWFYDEILYSIEQLDFYRVTFAIFKLRAEQVNFFHNL